MPGALRIRDLILRVAADPDLDQTAKLFAFCLAAWQASPERIEKKRTGKGRSWAQAIGEMMTGCSYERAVSTVRRVIADDIPRYEVRYERLCCPVLKTRGVNAGKPCGKNAISSWVERDPQTGAGIHVGFCSAHITAADKLRRQQLFQEWETNGRPVPPANKGGILARYFNADWVKLYAWADPTREPLPEGKPPTPPRPKFTLIHGGAASVLRKA